MGIFSGNAMTGLSSGGMSIVAISPEILAISAGSSTRAGGEDFELMIDIGKGWESVREGIDRAKRMEEHRLAWIEEPFWPDDYDKYARLAAAVDIPIAGGEEETTLADFERLVERGGVEIVQHLGQ